MAVELKRIKKGILKKKPKVVFDKRFFDNSSSEIGERGQIEVMMNVHSVDKTLDEEGNVVFKVSFIINQSSKVEEKGPLRT